MEVKRSGVLAFAVYERQRAAVLHCDVEASLEVEARSSEQERNVAVAGVADLRAREEYMVEKGAVYRAVRQLSEGGRGAIEGGWVFLRHLTAQTSSLKA